MVPESLRVLVFHGTSRTIDETVIANHDLVLTTYDVLASGYSADEAEAGGAAGAGAGDRSLCHMCTTGGGLYNLLQSVEIGALRI